VAAFSLVHDPLGRVSNEYHAFVELRHKSSSGSRFTTGAGNRYDYWRVAWSQFRDEPLHGLGAGNYDRTYFLERRTTEDVRQPHSVELQTLAELGLVGFAALALFLVAILMGLGRRILAAGSSLDDRAVAVAAGGSFLVWLAHTSVDWLHLIPGVTGLALASAAVLVGPWRRPTADHRTIARRALVLVATVAIVLGAVLVGRAAIAEKYRSDAKAALAVAPSEAISKADDSLRLDDESLATYYVKAAAYARLDDYGRARATLLEATRREPHDFVTWGLLGDLAVRRGAIAQARHAYGQAARLNPQDRNLTRMAKHPDSALPQH
jgi:tetratricopeptide (TPR) repeat protein